MVKPARPQFHVRLAPELAAKVRATHRRILRTFPGTTLEGTFAYLIRRGLQESTLLLEEEFS